MTSLVLVPSAIEWHMLTGAPETNTLPQAAPFIAFKKGRQIWALCGIGPAAAAMTAAHLIPLLKPERVVLAGIAGAFTQSQLQLGKIVQVNEECFADLGHQTNGWHNLDKMKLTMLPLANEALGCKQTLAVLDEAEPQATAITVSTVTSSHEGAGALWDEYRADLENMEGASVAMVCALHQLPCHQVRAVSNAVGPRDPASWKVREPLARLGKWLDRRLG